MEKRWKNSEISWDDFCKRVSTTQTTTETVEEYRKMTKLQQDSILYELQQHIMGLEESDKFLREEKDKASAELDRLKAECRAAENAIEAASRKRMADFEAYALGKKKSYDASMEQMEKLRKKHMELLKQMLLAEEKVREYSRVKMHENFAVMKLTPKLMDEYVESVEVHPGNKVRIGWK